MKSFCGETNEDHKKSNIHSFTKFIKPDHINLGSYKPIPLHATSTNQNISNKFYQEIDTIQSIDNTSSLDLSHTLNNSFDEIELAEINNKKEKLSDIEFMVLLLHKFTKKCSFYKIIYKKESQRYKTLTRMLFAILVLFCSIFALSFITQLISVILESELEDLIDLISWTVTNIFLFIKFFGVIVIWGVVSIFTEIYKNNYQKHKSINRILFGVTVFIGSVFALSFIGQLIEINLEYNQDKKIDLFFWTGVNIILFAKLFVIVLVWGIINPSARACKNEQSYKEFSKMLQTLRTFLKKSRTNEIKEEEMEKLISSTSANINNILDSNKLSDKNVKKYNREYLEDKYFQII